MNYIHFFFLQNQNLHFFNSFARAIATIQDQMQDFHAIFMFVYAVIKTVCVSWDSFACCTCTLTVNNSLYFFQAERDGSNEYSNYQPGSLNTTDQLIRDLQNIDIVFHIGDISYANGYISQWDQFTSQVEPIASAVPYMIGRFVQLFIAYYQ